MMIPPAVLVPIAAAGLIVCALTAGLYAGLHLARAAAAQRSDRSPTQRVAGSASLALVILNDLFSGRPWDGRLRTAAGVLAGTVGLATALMTGNIVFSLMAAGGVAAGTTLISSMRRAATARNFEVQFSDALEAIARRVRAGQSFQQALQSASRECGAAVAPVVADMVRRFSLGQALGDVLTVLTGRGRDAELFAAAVTISRDTGASLPAMLDRITGVIQERRRISARVSALTAQGRASGMIMTAAPVALLILLTVMEPNMMSVLYTTTEGSILLCIAAIMTSAGFYFVNRLARVEY